MNDISKIAEVIGVATKKDGTELRGISTKNGKEWVMYSVILENGVKMNTFGPVSVGDIMFNLKQDEQYHNWKGELKRQGDGTKVASSVNASQPTLAQIMHKLEEIETLLKGKAETGPLHYVKAGRKGGQNGKGPFYTGGFAGNRELARTAGARGGKISKRLPSTK